MKSLDDILLEQKKKRKTSLDRKDLLTQIHKGIYATDEGSTTRLLRTLRDLRDEWADLSDTQRQEYMVGVKHLKDHYDKLSSSQQKQVMDMMTDMMVEMKESGKETAKTVTDFMASSRPSMTLPIGFAIDELKVQSLDIPALNEAFAQLLVHLEELREDINSKLENIVINVPEPRVTVNVPEIKVPAAKVTVTMPEPVATAPTAATPLTAKGKTKAIPLVPVRELVEFIPTYDATGKNLTGMTEVFSDGTKRKVKVS